MTAAGPATRAGAAGGRDAMRLRDAPMIFMYHAVADVTEDPNQLAVSPARFAEQMAWLQRSGLRGVSMGTLTEAMQAGRAAGLVGLTFDDGYTSMLDAVVPELRRYGFGATAFIITDLMGRTNEWDAGPVWPLLDTAGVRELAGTGIEIGSHSSTHPHLAGLPAAGRRPRSPPAVTGWRTCCPPRSRGLPTPTALWTRRPGTPWARPATSTPALLRRRWPSSGRWRCRGCTSGSGIPRPG